MEVGCIAYPSGSTVTYSLVYPRDANVDGLRISVLARLGVAILGESEGTVIEYAITGGPKRFRIERVDYQPESRLRVPARNGTHTV